MISFAQLEWLGKRPLHLAHENAVFNMRLVLVSTSLVHQSESFQFSFQSKPQVITLALVNVLMANMKTNMVNVFIKMNVPVLSGTSRNAFYYFYNVT